MLKEFKEFAFKGNLIDMAVGIIIGGAFGTVVKSLVDDIFMPLIGVVTGGVDFSRNYLVLKGEVPKGTSVTRALEMDDAVILTWGNFATSFVSFVILAFVLFLVIKKFLAALNREKEAAPAEPEAPAADIALLTEIRDLLKQKG